MTRSKLIMLLGFVLGFIFFASEASAIPAFSRKYKAGCNLCHTVYPRVNEFGRDFKNRGFRMEGEVDSSSTGKDFWEKGMEELPVTVHGKFSEQIAPKGQTVGTATALDELQLNAAVNFSNKVSFYLHTHLWEDGETGKPLVVAVGVNDLFGTSLVNLRVGQFQPPLSFSPEIERLMAFEYPIFSESIGGNGFSVDQPQLGIELTGDLGKDFWYWVGVVNGNGFQKSPFTDSFDNNPAKDVYLRVAKNIGENTIGLFGYFGNHSVFQDSPDSLGLNQKDQFYRIGGDINLSFSSTNIRTAFLYGHDGNFNGLAQSTFYYGGFLECNYYPSDRCVLVGRYDLVQHEDPEASSEAVQQKTTWALTPGIQYLVLPNIKVGFEYQLRQYREQDRALAYLHFAL